MGKKVAPKSTERTTSITPASQASTLHAFSPSTPSSKSLLYAHLHRAPDAHTLRVYDATTGKCLSRWASNSAADGDDDKRVASLAWAVIPAPAASTSAAAAGGASAGEEEAKGKRGKKRRKSDSAAEQPVVDGKVADEAKLVLALGLEDGAILLWTPTGSNSTPTVISHPSSTSAITALSSPVGTSTPSGHLWSAHADGSVRVWDLEAGALIAKIGEGLNAGGKAWDDIAVRYLPVPASADDSKKRPVQILLSHLSIHLFSVSLATSSKKDKVRELKPVEIGRSVGHVDKAFVRWSGRSSLAPSASPDEAMEDDDATSTPLTFISHSSTDRFVQVWSLVPSSTSQRVDATLTARLGLDSGVQSLAIGSSPLNDEEEQVLAAIDVEGKVAVARLPFVIPVAKGTPGKKGKGAGIVALEVESQVTARNGEGAGVVEVKFGESGKVWLCRSSVKPTFDQVAFADEEGAWVAKVEVEKSTGGLLNGAVVEGSAALPTRYSETTSAIRSGDAQAEPTSDDEDLVNSGELDVDAAEPTLADRLKALDVAKSGRKSAFDIDDDVEAAVEDEDDGEEDVVPSGPSVPATTLTTTLIQALHSSDAPLLESCLTHSSPTLIRSTVKRLPSGSLVLNLLEVLVEKLGKGKKGTPGAASVQRARGLIEWVRQVLIVHVGFLVTIPSLVTRLATLHASLTSRLALQPSLLALDGRLELVMSQIELQQERVAARATITPGAGSKSQGTKYVEGESDESGSEDGDVGMEGEEDSEDEGSVEDVVLGSEGEVESGEEDEDEFDDEEFSDEEEEEAQLGGKKRKGKVDVSELLELEASEASEDESDEGSDEESEEEEGSESD
ncbi:U3 small nucleolar RNA-associated protein 5 [Pseudohyphozyma bogoriensis]|nr:U3 small nucleolar RNA-associated protein 5 [Pseudohyphozyma bogoriensis]